MFAIDKFTNINVDHKQPKQLIRKTKPKKIATSIENPAETCSIKSEISVNLIDFKVGHLIFQDFFLKISYAQP